VAFVLLDKTSFAALVKPLCRAGGWLTQAHPDPLVLGAKAQVPSFSADGTKTKAQLLAALAASYDYGTAVLSEQTADKCRRVRYATARTVCQQARLAHPTMSQNLHESGFPTPTAIDPGVECARLPRFTELWRHGSSRA
jgi:hypothetical protein